jgi:hypothetical protein
MADNSLGAKNQCAEKDQATDSRLVQNDLGCESPSLEK